MFEQCIRSQGVPNRLGAWVLHEYLSGGGPGFWLTSTLFYSYWNLAMVRDDASEIDIMLDYGLLRALLRDADLTDNRFRKRPASIH